MYTLSEYNTENRLSQVVVIRSDKNSKLAAVGSVLAADNLPIVNSKKIKEAINAPERLQLSPMLLLFSVLRSLSTLSLSVSLFSLLLARCLSASSTRLTRLTRLNGLAACPSRTKLNQVESSEPSQQRDLWRITIYIHTRARASAPLSNNATHGDSYIIA